MGELEDHPAYKAGTWIWYVGSPVLLTVGTVGNILSIIVLLRPTLRRFTTMFYLTCLSFGDLFSLYTGLLRYWIHQQFNVDVRNASNASCKIHTFLVYLSLDFTVWVLVSVTVDRCLSVSLPFRARRMCNRKTAVAVIVTLFIVMCVKNMHFLWTVSLVHTWEFQCHANTPAHAHFISYVWPWIDMVIFCIIPFSTMIICNIKIIYEMISSHNKLNAHKPDVVRFPSVTEPQHPPTLNVDSPEQAPPSEYALTPNFRRQRSVRSRTTSESSNPAATNTKTSKRHINSLTAMLLVVNTVFLLTTSPIQIVLIGEEYWFPERDTSVDDVAWYTFWWALVNILQYMNNAIHFFLYCLTGPKFRNEFYQLFRRKNKVCHDNAVARERTLKEQTEF